MIETPWLRTPAIAIPTQPTIGDALRDLDSENLAALIQANLLPRDPQRREEWAQMWAEIAADQDLTDEVSELLESWLEISQRAAQADPDPKTAKRIDKFIGTVQAGLDRLDKPLAWLGPQALRYDPRSRRDIERLIDAIDQHRTRTTQPTPHDRDLWAVLAQLHLDPEQA